MKIQIIVRKITENLGFESPLWSKNFCPFSFSFHFQILVLLFRNQIKHMENVCFYWYLICKTRYSKLVKNKHMQFFMENLKMNRKRAKIFLTLRRGEANPKFLVIFPTMIWIFMEGEGDKIKSRQAFKRDRTLLVALIRSPIFENILLSPNFFQYMSPKA